MEYCLFVVIISRSGGIKMKKMTTIKRILAVLTVATVGAPYSVKAQTAPYVLTQSVNNIPVERQACTALITELSETTSTDDSTFNDKQSQLDELQQQYEQLNQSIQQLEKEIATLKPQLAQQIEQVYQQLLTQDPAFAQLEESDQLSQIQSQSEVQNLNQQLQDLNDQMAYQIKERESLAQQYQTLNYELTQHNEELEQTSEQKAQLNQCLLYPYSVSHRTIDLTVLNQQLSLDDYLAQVDQIMQQIVPVAYRKVHYQDIATLFQLGGRDLDQLTAELAGKEVIELAQEGEYYYGYARELNLYDIEILANQALKVYLETQDKTSLTQAFQRVLAIRQAQFEYFVSLNPSQFEHLKAMLGNYLNQSAYSDEMQMKLDQLHERYQLQLVHYDQAQGQWQSIANDDNGFHDQYTVYDLFQAEVANKQEAENGQEPAEQAEQIPATEVTTPSKKRRHPFAPNLSEKEVNQKNKESIATTTDKQAKLDRLKDKLLKAEPQATKKHQLTPQTKKGTNPTHKPTDNQSETEAKESPSSKKSKGDSAKLPSTGEQQTALWWALGCLLLAAGLTGWNLYQRAKQKAKLKKIKLD